MVVLVYATISTVLLVHQYSVQISDWDTLLVYEFITLSDRSQSSSYQGIQRCVLVQNISGVLISQGCIPLNDIWGHPDGISCLYWIPAPTDHTECTHVCVQCHPLGHQKENATLQHLPPK